jgi:K+-transporting ATPase KdpF subunit
MRVAAIRSVVMGNTGFIVTGIISLLLTAYLFAALLWPEKF